MSGSAFDLAVRSNTSVLDGRQLVLMNAMYLSVALQCRQSWV